ncbi:MAG: Grx4 family monothiol glutaredoxin [Rickettsiales bacterium]|nr:Grx4 family monothiol glutaredoxin [Rickettsiales bacterium]
MQEKFQEIENLIKNNKIVLFMKGNKTFPQCGFSAFVAKTLQNLNIEFTDVNILEDEEMRQAIKDYTDWPTIPQLYVNGEFIGGCDIIREMQENGELEEALK